MNPQTVLAVAPLVIRIIKIAIPVLVGLLLIPIIAVAAILNKSTVAWPVATPVEVGVGPDYVATGWSMTSPYGWREDISDPSQYEFHDGMDLDGEMFCDGCRVPTMGDVEIVGIGWDDPSAADPLHAGAGVVVDMMLQHPQESGTIRIRYGHLKPFLVFVRTRSCQETVSCPGKTLDGAADVTVTCAGEVVTITDPPRPAGEYGFAYAEPGACTATVTWPAPYLPEGATTFVFDQQIVEGVESSNVAITFDAILPAPTADFDALWDELVDLIVRLWDLADVVRAAGMDTEADAILAEKDAFRDRLHAAVDVPDLETLKGDVEDAIADAEALLTMAPPPPPDPLRGDIQSLLTELERLADELDAAGEPGEAADVRDRIATFADDLSNATTTSELEDLRDDILVAIGDAEDVLGIDLDDEKEVVEELLEDVEDLVDALDDAGLDDEANDLEDTLDDFDDALDDATSRHELEDLTTEITREIAEIEDMLSLEDDIEDALEELRDVADRYDDAGENSIAERLREDADEYEEELENLVADDADREEFADLLEDIVDDVDDARDALP